MLLPISSRHALAMLFIGDWALRGHGAELLCIILPSLICAVICTICTVICGICAPLPCPPMSLGRVGT